MAQTTHSTVPTTSLEQLVEALRTLGVQIPNADVPPPTAPAVLATPANPPPPVTLAVPTAAPVTLAVPAAVPVAPAVPTTTRGQVSGFVCTTCHTFNPLTESTSGSRSTNGWYAVTAGLSVGVFKGWHVAQPLVSGVSHACYKGYPTEAMARAALDEAGREGKIKVLTKSN